ncbi:hypothetical protein TNIN_157811, partial [Trichonephila inaurata madagascariensis]
MPKHSSFRHLFWTPGVNYALISVRVRMLLEEPMDDTWNEGQ